VLFSHSFNFPSHELGLGEHGETLTGCIRRDSQVYLLLEVVVFELLGMNIARPWDEAAGISRLIFQ